MKSPWLGIKQIPHSLVKPPILAALLISCVAGAALMIPASASAQGANNGLPEIEAKTFNLTIQRRSRSGRVYLMQTEEQEELHQGKLILLRRDNRPIMAFRVLRDYPEKNQFAAKWLRRYGGIHHLEPQEQYFAIEKISDRAAPPLTAQDRKELKELEEPLPPPAPAPQAPAPEALPPPAPGAEEIPAPEAAPAAPSPQASPAPEFEAPPPLPSEELPPPLPSEELPPPAPSEELPPPGPEEAQPSTLGPSKGYDKELDSTTTPSPTGEETLLTPADEAELDDLKSITAEELVPLDRDWNSSTLGFGFFHNNGASPGGGSSYFGGIDLKYARTLRKMIYFKKKNLQDSIALEGGLGYYGLVNFASTQDSFSVVPVTVTLRYSLNVGEDLTPFAYIGLNKNFVTSSGTADPANESAVDTARTQLDSVLPAIGIGILFHIGPNWYIRMDAGADLIGVGLMLRY